MRQPIPVFNTSDLSKRSESAIRSLYSDMPHQYHEDALRFRTLAQLQQHTDAFLEKKKLLLKKKDATNKEARLYREWYCLLEQWISDFNALDLTGNTTTQPANGAYNLEGNTSEEVFILPADENFPRCPISKEMFECVWDDEEGEMMYRNAVKVLVLESVDSGLFKVSKPIDLEENDSTGEVRYMIVHKLLVMDVWLKEGKAVTLKEARARLLQSSNEKNKLLAETLLTAAGEDLDEDETFMLWSMSLVM